MEVQSEEGKGTTVSVFLPVTGKQGDASLSDTPGSR